MSGLLVDVETANATSSLSKNKMIDEFKKTMKASSSYGYVGYEHIPKDIRDPRWKQILNSILKKVALVVAKSDPSVFTKPEDGDAYGSRSYPSRQMGQKDKIIKSYHFEWDDFRKSNVVVDLGSDVEVFISISIKPDSFYNTNKKEKEETAYATYVTVIPEKNPQLKIKKVLKLIADEIKNGVTYHKIDSYSDIPYSYQIGVKIGEKNYYL